jgi:hypothetical protein
MYAKRAAVTIMTNYNAFDGRTHTYSDTSGDWWDYFLYEVEDGTWQTTGTAQWTVRDMTLGNYGNAAKTNCWIYYIDMNIRYDRQTQTYTATNVTSQLYFMDFETGENYLDSPRTVASHPIFTVSRSAIEQDRTVLP